MSPELLTSGAIATLLGLFAPILIQWLNKWVRNEAGRYAVALGLSAVTATVVVFATGTEWAFTPLFITGFFTVASTAYKLYWKQLFNKNDTLSLPPSSY